MDAGASTLIAAARTRLAGSPRVRLGELVESRRVFGIGRAPRIVPVGEAWHLGVLLIGDEQVFATGEVLRARHDAIRGFTAQSQRERSDRAAAAHRGGFAEGETVHVGWRELDLSAVAAAAASDPLLIVAGVPHVRWNTAGGTRPLADYLDEQLALR
ncbi:glutaminase [Microbacterium invictum]|nr:MULTISPECIES: glutaminase [Microbacterium]